MARTAVGRTLEVSIDGPGGRGRNSDRPVISGGWAGGIGALTAVVSGGRAGVYGVRRGVGNNVGILAGWSIGGILWFEFVEGA